MDHHYLNGALVVLFSYGGRASKNEMFNAPMKNKDRAEANDKTIIFEWDHLVGGDETDDSDLGYILSYNCT